MTVSKFFGELQHRIQYLENRKHVIDRNIVNNDTPGYVAQDLEFKAQLQHAQASQLVQTHPQHISVNATGKQGGFKIVAEENPLEISPNGNTVNLEQETLKIAQTADDHEVMTRLYREGLAMHRSALGKN